MVLRSTIRFAFILMLSFAAFAQQQPWVPVGPDGGDVRTLTLDPHASNRVLLTTSAGMIFESNNGGVNWTRLARLGDRNDYVIDSLIFQPTRENVVFAGAWSVEDNRSGDVLKSLDGGRTWKKLRDMHGESVRALAMAASDPNVLVAGTLTGVYRSTDAGEHWSLISPPNHADIRNVESIAIDPMNPEVIYAGTWHLPWKTTDGGLTWKNIKNGIIDDSDVFSIIIDPHSPNVIYASACSGIYKSENAGESFRKVQGIPYTSRRTRVLMQDPVRSEVVYAGTTEGLWRTVDSGQSWTRLTGGNIIVNDILIDPIDAKKVMLATDRSGVLASSDWGNQFFASNRGFAHRQVSSLLVDLKESSTVYAGVINDKEFGGVFTSRDGGSQWNQMSAGLDGADVYVLQQNDKGDLFAGTNRGVFAYRSVAGSYRWTPLQVTTTARYEGKGKSRKLIKPSAMNFRVNDLEINGDLWLAAGVSGLFTSKDQGKSWVGGMKEGLSDFIAVRRLGDEALAIARRGLLVSRDGGVTWKKPSLPPVSILTDGVLDDRGNMYFAAREGVYRSTDRGVTWARLNRTPIVNLSAIIWDKTGERLLISSSKTADIFESRDQGDHWRTVPVGWAVRHLRVAGERAFAATQFDGIVTQPQLGFTERASGVVSLSGAQD
jgi:photosystem II stability/assembly factor-like uncharacterized protein